MPDEIEDMDGHLRMATGFLATCQVAVSASGCEVRNAISRSYYARFHICNAWLAMQGVLHQRRKDHRKLQKEIGKAFGAESRGRLREFYVLREKAYYKREMPTGGTLAGDIERFRTMARGTVERVTADFYPYLVDIERHLRTSGGYTTP